MCLLNTFGANTSPDHRKYFSHIKRYLYNPHNIVYCKNETLTASYMYYLMKYLDPLESNVNISQNFRKEPLWCVL